MKIFISQSEQSSAQHATFQKVVEYLKKQGHSLKTDADFKKGVKGTDSAALEKYQTKVDKAIRDTDLMVVDVTNPDAKVGYDVSKGLGEKKVVIALQHDSAKDTMIPALHANGHRTFLLRSFDDSNFQTVVSEAVEEAKGKMDTKFILIISPEIDRYLDWASQTKRMHKAQIVRNSIEASLKKDKEYKTFLQG